MEINPDIEFDYRLAARLGVLVADLHERMSNAEYVGWQVYYGRAAQRRQLARGGAPDGGHDQD